jgi:hypothetical protein
VPINQFIPTQAPGLAQTPTGAGLGAYSQAISNQFAPQMMRSQMFSQQAMPLAFMGQSPMMGLLPQYRDAWAQAMTNAIRNLDPNAQDIGQNLAPFDAIQNAAMQKLGSGALKFFGINLPAGSGGSNDSSSSSSSVSFPTVIGGIKGMYYANGTNHHFVPDTRQG